MKYKTEFKIKYTTYKYGYQTNEVDQQVAKGTIESSTVKDATTAIDEIREALTKYYLNQELQVELNITMQ